MIVNVAKILLQRNADLRYPAAEKLGASFEQRFGGVFENHEPALSGVQSFDLLAVGLVGENTLFDVLDGGLDAIENGKIAIDHGIHKRIEHVARAVAQKLGFLFAAGAHVGEAALGARPHREHILRAGKNRHFTDVELAIVGLDQMEHDE